MKILFVALLVLSSLGLQAQTTSPMVLEKYNCQGTGAEGEYKTTLTVERQGDNYFLAWPEVGTQGMGLRVDNDLAVVFITQAGGVGATLYRILDGRLVGWWAGGDGQVFREFCSVGMLV